MVSGGASYLQGQKAAKNAKSAGELNRVSNLVNGQIEGARARFNAQGAQYQSLISSEDLKVNELIVRANRKKAALEGDVQANKLMLDRDRIARQAAEQQADLTRNNLGITRERRLAQNQFQRSVSDVRFAKAMESSQTKARLASMGLSVTSGIAQSVDSSYQREADKAILGLSDQALVTERAANNATTQNLKKIERIESIAEEETAFTSFRASVLRQETEFQDTIFGLEADNLSMQSDYMKWNARAAVQGGELEARVLETGAELRAASSVQMASSQASAAKAQGFSGFVSGMGNAASSIAQGVNAARDQGQNKFLGFKI